MAKDDYSYIVFKILTYLYGCFKRKFSFDKETFENAIIKAKDVPDEYITDILRYMTDDELITGLVFKPVWGGEYILINEFKDMRITTKGIAYLEENDHMKQVKSLVITGSGAITELAKIVFSII